MERSLVSAAVAVVGLVLFAVIPERAVDERRWSLITLGIFGITVFVAGLAVTLFFLIHLAVASLLLSLVLATFLTPLVGAALMLVALFVQDELCSS